MVFYIFLGVWIIIGVAWFIALRTFSNPSEAEMEMISTMKWAFSSTLGAWFGIPIGGYTVKP